VASLTLVSPGVKTDGVTYLLVITLCKMISDKMILKYVRSVRKGEGDYGGKDLRKMYSFESAVEWNRDGDGVMHSESCDDDDDDDDELVRERGDDSDRDSSSTAYTWFTVSDLISTVNMVSTVGSETRAPSRSKYRPSQALMQ